MGISSTGSDSTPIINFHTYYRKRAATVATPEATAWLEYVQLNLRVVTCASSNSSGAGVQFEVQAHYLPPFCPNPGLVWTVSRPFNAYRHFRKQVMRRLRPGHVCSAECKWLYAVLKNHFPKLKLLTSNLSRTEETRRQTLLRVLRTLQASLINRGNQGCDVLVHGVSREFAAFIVGEKAKLPERIAMMMSECSSDQKTRQSAASYMSNCSGDENSCDETLQFGDMYGCTSGRGCYKS